MKRVEARWLCSIPLLVASGCYSHHTADEGLLNLDFPVEDGGGATVPDAGKVASDAGVSSGCTQTDTVQRLICEYTQRDAGGGSSCTQTDTVQRLICEYNQGNLGGTTRRDAGGGQLDPDEVQDLIDQLTGGGDLDLLDLIELANKLQDPPDLQDLIDQLRNMRRDAGSQSQPNAQQCRNATDLQTLIQCALAGFGTRN